MGNCLQPWPQHPIDVGDMSTGIGRHLGRAVRARREALGLSQEAVARRAKMDRAYLSNLEGGSRNPSVDAVDRLAGALDTAASLLMAEAEAHREEER